MSKTAKYEILYIIRPELEEDAKNELVTRFDTILKENGAEITESKDWSKRRFAYEINLTTRYITQNMAAQTLSAHLTGAALLKGL